MVGTPKLLIGSAAGSDVFSESVIDRLELASETLRGLAHHSLAARSLVFLQTLQALGAIGRLDEIFGRGAASRGYS